MITLLTQGRSEFMGPGFAGAANRHGTAAMLDRAIGPTVIRNLKDGMERFLDKNANRGWKSLSDFRGLRRDQVVPQSQIARPGASDYHGGHDAEGYAESFETPVTVGK